MLIRCCCWIVVVLVVGCALLANFLAPAGYTEQYREEWNSPPSMRFPLGTDELGRDRFARTLYGCRVSFVLAPCAAAVAVAVAAILGLAAASLGGMPERLIMSAADLLASVPTLFLILSVRAVLPLDIEPAASICVTFMLLGGLGWANGARVIRVAAIEAQGSSYILQARAAGCSGWRMILSHLVPTLRPVLSAQFWTAVPLFLIAEANLGILGLSVTEPLPSLGNMLSDLHQYTDAFSAPWRLGPAFMLVLAILSVYQLTRSVRST